MSPQKLTGKDLLILSGGIICASALRVAMSPYPNIEPVMLATVVAGVSMGVWAGFLTGLLTMVISNIAMATSPLTFPWILSMPLVTLYTSLAYGLVGLFAGLAGGLWKNMGRYRLAVLSGVLTVFYDLVTAVCFGLQFYGLGGVPLALEAQVPFTLMHLSNVVFVFLFAPYLVGVVGFLRSSDLLGFLGFGGVKTAE